MHMGISMGVNRLPIPSIAQRAIAAIRRNNGSAWFVPDDYGLVLGPELTPGFASSTGWTLGTGISVSGGVLNFSSVANNQNAQYGSAIVAGKTYRVSITVSSLSGGPIGLLLSGGSGVSASGIGTFTTATVASLSGSFYVWQQGASATTATITSISVREVISAQLYTDSTGTTPVTAVGDLVGLLTDRSYGAGNLGVELVTNGDMNVGLTSWATNNGTLSLVDGAARVTSTATAQNCRLYDVPGFTCVVGKTYVAQVDVISSTSINQVQLTVGTGAGFSTVTGSSGSGLGTRKVMFVATATTMYLWTGAAIDSGQYFDSKNFSVREVLGNHATQATPANKPVITRVPRRLGANLVVNGDFSAGVTGWTPVGATISIVAGALRVQNSTSDYGFAIGQFPTIAGRSYRLLPMKVGGAPSTSVNFHVGSTSGGSQILVNQDASVPVVFTALTATTYLSIFAGGNTVGNYTDYDNITVQEVLEWSNAMSFDGSNDSLTVPVNTGTSGAFIVACTPSATTWRMVAGSGATSPADRGARIGFDGSGRYYGTTSNGSAVSESNGVAATANAAVVMTFMWSPSTQWLYVNGVLADTRASTVSASTSGLIRVGGNAVGSDFLAGSIADFAYIPGTLTEADRKTVERYLASQIGATYAG